MDNIENDNLGNEWKYIMLYASEGFYQFRCDCLYSILIYIINN